MGELLDSVSGERPAQPGAAGLSALARQLAARTRGLSEAIGQHAVVTPLIGMGAASESCAAEILLKCEHQQKTGSFKVRGALAKLLTLSSKERERGVVAASTGNHGLGVAYALSVLGGNGIVCVPEHASPVKVAAIRRRGAQIRLMGQDPGQTEKLARQLAAAEGMTYISPYNDLDVIAGQGTIGAEMVRQLGGRPVHAVVAAVGGGGLISGIAATVKAALPGIRVIGASPANDAAMAASVRAGTVAHVSARPTISDGTAGGVEEGSITLPLCTELVDEWMLIEEQDIFSALRLVIETEHQLVEGSAAMAVAAGLRAGRRFPGQTIAVVSCGANISADVLASAITSAVTPPGALASHSGGRLGEPAGPLADLVGQLGRGEHPEPGTDHAKRHDRPVQ
jgi:threonine dehydratase